MSSKNNNNDKNISYNIKNNNESYDKQDESYDKQDNKYQHILSSLEEAYYEVDLAGKFIFFNDSLCRITGFSRDELLGNSYKLFSNNPEAVHDAFNNVYQTGVPEKGFVWKITKKNNEELFIEVSISLIKDEQGQVEGFRGVARNINDRVKAEEALKRSEERYRQILASIEEAYYEADLKGNFLFFNDSLCQMTGYNREELQGKNYSIIADDPDSVYLVYNKVYQKGEPDKGFVWKLITKSGQKKFVEVSVSLIKEGNMATGFRGVIRDITKRINMEESLKKSEEKYREILASIQEGYYEVDLRGYYTFVNEAFYKVTGYSQEEVIGHSYKKFIKNHEEIFEIYNRVFRTGEPEKGFLLYLITKNGELKYVENSASLMKDDDGYLIGFRGICRDVTERMLNESRIHQQKKHFEALYTNSTDAIVFLNSNQEVEDANGQFIFLFGYRLQEIKGKKLGDLIVPQDNYLEAIRLEYKVFQGESLQHEATRKNKNGDILEVIIKGVPVIIDGDVTGGYIIFSDITKKKEYENQLQYLSLYDHLTGIYNRAYFDKVIERLNNDRKHPLSIIVIDINDMKLINDTLGHDAGDNLLKTCANILKNSISENDIVARIGGDEFVLILPETPQNNAIEVARKITKNISDYKKDNPETPLNVSIGIATTVDEKQPLMEIFKQADNDMYRDKLSSSKRSRGDIVNTLLNTLAERDFITGGHAERMSRMSKKLGETLGLLPRQLNDLVLLSHVHDLGKVGVPDNILFKPGKLNQDEWEQMKKHPEIGHRIAQSSADLKHISELILYHHERWDGTGYPQGLKGEEIPIECRIMTIVDAFDAMTNVRPYRNALTIQEAVDELKRCSGTQFDPHLIDFFIKLISKEDLETLKKQEDKKDNEEQENQEDYEKD